MKAGADGHGSQIACPSGWAISRTAAAGTWLLVFVALGRALREGVPERARAVTSAALVATSGVWLAMVAVRRVNDLYVARLSERAHPAFRNTLVDAIQLRGRADLPGSVVAAVMARAAALRARQVWITPATRPGYPAARFFCPLVCASWPVLSQAHHAPRRLRRVRTGGRGRYDTPR